MDSLSLHGRKLTLPQDNKTILASQYQLYLPTEEQFIQEINEVKALANYNKNTRL